MIPFVGRLTIRVGGSAGLNRTTFRASSGDGGENVVAGTTMLAMTHQKTEN